MRFARAAERAPRGRALFSFGGCARAPWPVLVLAGLLGVHGTGRTAECAADHIDERARVAHVYDGDTVVLADRRKVRLIGINTPELSREETPGQPYAQEARVALAALLEPNAEIGLRFDEQRLDHYGRLLAHLYRADGGSIQAWLLQRGYAAAITVPPNLWNQECYRRAEARARRGAEGLWRLDYYQPLAAADIKSDVLEEGFRFVRGKVVRTASGANAVWLNLEGGLALRIARADLRYFPAFRPRDLVGQVVVARGWLHARGTAPVMQIRHPAALQLEAGEGTPP